MKHNIYNSYYTKKMFTININELLKKASKYISYFIFCNALQIFKLQNNRIGQVYIKYVLNAMIKIDFGDFEPDAQICINRRTFKSD